MIDETKIQEFIENNNSFFSSISLDSNNTILISYLDDRRKLESAVADYVKIRDYYNKFFREHATKKIYLNPVRSHDETTDFGIHRLAVLDNENYIIQLKKERKNLINTKPKKMSEEELQIKLKEVTNKINAARKYATKLEDRTSPESRNVVYEYRRINMEPNLIDDNYLEEFNKIKSAIIQLDFTINTYCNNLNNWKLSAKNYIKAMPEERIDKGTSKTGKHKNRTN